MTRREIDAAVLRWIADGARAPHDDGRFGHLALGLFRHQVAHCEPYARLCAALSVDPESVAAWHDIPAVPTGAFKTARLACFPPDEEVRVFRTSGSTTDGRGSLHLDTLEIYEASLLASFSAWICPEGERIRFCVLAPSGREMPDSSLSWMFEVAVRELGAPGSRFYVGPDGWDPEGALRDLGSATAPVAVVGTAFAFVHLLDHLESRRVRLELPPGSRAMETGGFKGRSREVPREALHAGIHARLGIARDRIVNQYGMCELGSQFYEDSLVTGRPSRVKRGPPWVRTRIVDPSTLENLEEGEVGILTHYDLANTGSVLAVQTSDLGRRVGGGFEVLGRIPEAEARGCSIAADLRMGG